MQYQQRLAAKLEFIDSLKIEKDFKPSARYPTYLS